MSGTERPELSVVVPVYNEIEGLGALVHRVRDALDGARIDWELVLVDDDEREVAGRILRLDQEFVEGDIRLERLADSEFFEWRGDGKDLPSGERGDAGEV